MTPPGPPSEAAGPFLEQASTFEVVRGCRAVVAALAQSGLLSRNFKQIAQCMDLQ